MRARSFLVLLLAACGRTTETHTSIEARDAGLYDAGTVDLPDGSSVQDAGNSATDSAARSRVGIFPRRGNPVDDATAPVGPGLLLDSGGEGVATWMHTQAVGGVSGRGDVVILSANGGDDSGPFVGATYGSVQSISIPDDATEAEYREAAATVEKAEIVWFPGGDQAHYGRWKGSALLNAVQRVYDRGGVVGGSSAGMIILGGAVNDAFNTISENITTAVCLADPFDQKLHFTQNVFRFPPLAGAITDPHFVARDRMGRLVTFVARQVTDGIAPRFRGIAVDDGAALAIDKNGLGIRLAAGDGPSVYIVDGGAPTHAVAGDPLVYNGLSVVRLASAEHRFDFPKNCGRGLAYALDVNGASPTPYSTNPYASGVDTDSCR